MKKYLLGLLILILFIPSAVSAAWWNPGSWFKNWSFLKRTETKTEVLEKRIQELEVKLQNTTSTNELKIETSSTSEKIKEKTKTEKTKKEDISLKKSTQSIIVQTPVQPIVQVPIKNVQLEIGKCKVSSQTYQTQLINQGLLTLENKYNSDVAKIKEAMQQAQNGKYHCDADITPEEDRILSPAAQARIRDACRSGYQSTLGLLTNQYNTLQYAYQTTQSKAYAIAQSFSDQEYAKCINSL